MLFIVEVHRTEFLFASTFHGGKLKFLPASSESTSFFTLSPLLGRGCGLGLDFHPPFFIGSGHKETGSTLHIAHRGKLRRKVNQLILIICHIMLLFVENNFISIRINLIKLFFSSSSPCLPRFTDSFLPSSSPSPPSASPPTASYPRPG